MSLCEFCDLFFWHALLLAFALGILFARVLSHVARWIFRRHFKL